jgi:hypothetical protein
MFWPLILSIATVLCASLLMFIHLVRTKGLDPSLINYSNPLISRGFWPLRVVLAGGFISVLAYRAAAGFLLGATLSTCLIQLAILIIFTRLPTQPALYFAGNAATAAALLMLPEPASLLAAAVLIAAQEIYLASWQRRSLEIYNKWICSRAINLNHKFQEFFIKLPTGLRFAVLHIAVTEDIARPAVVRLAERAYFYLRRPLVISTGIMQVAANRPMSDLESLDHGARLIKDALDRMPSNNRHAHDQILRLAESYNGSTTYRIYLEATYPGVLAAWDKIKH